MEQSTKEKFYSGFITILGSPNAGKSTLINDIIGTKVAIVTNKPQTTRNVIQGIYLDKDCQMVFLDTPGLHNPKNKLGKYMMRSANESIKDIDAVLYVIDVKSGVRQKDIENIIGYNVPLVIALNKTDLVLSEKIKEEKEKLKGLSQINKIFEISALKNEGIDDLISCLKKYMPEGPKYYDDNMYTDRPEMFIAAEMIREKAFLALEKELPYGVGVEIEKISFREDKDIVDVCAVIYCEKKSHKGMIIGKKGEMLKKIGFLARSDLEMLFGQKVYLELWVKVKEDWRNKDSILKLLGYD
ncbi:MAG: GTPase Era [Eubacteriales bacterium]